VFLADVMCNTHIDLCKAFNKVWKHSLKSDTRAGKSLWEKDLLWENFWNTCKGTVHNGQTPVNGKNSCTLFSTSLMGISTLVIYVTT